MARNGKVKLNHRGMEKLLKSAGVRAILQAPAQRVLEAAKADPHDDTGDYEAGLHIVQATTDRAVTRVMASDWKSGILQAKYGILTRALDAAK